MRSYYTPIATIHKVRKQKVLLITERTYSVTTSMHKNLVWRAWPSGGGPIFHVPSLGAGEKIDHKKNKEHFQKVYEQWRAYMHRIPADNWSEWRRNYLLDLNAEIDRYCATFGLAPSRNNTSKDIADIEARVERIKQSADYKNRAHIRELRAERRRLERERQQKEYEARIAEELKVAVPEWIAGTRNYLPYGIRTVYLRLKGEDVVQTSLGAEIPLSAGHMLFTFLQTAPLPWEGHIRIGNFICTSISADKTLIAGCHTIKWPEIEDFARRMGWLA